jgi:hypothetical protein
MATLIPNLSPFNPLLSGIEEDIDLFNSGVKPKIRNFFGFRTPKWSPPQTKFFFKTFNQIEALFLQSPTAQIALILSEPNSNTNFRITWLSLNTVTESQISNLSSSTVYFIFTRQMYDEISNKLSIGSDRTPGGLCAIVGKDGNDLFLHILRKDYLKKQIDSEGGPPYAGVRVPG